jgi:hypothetical protein
MRRRLYIFQHVTSPARKRGSICNSSFRQTKGSVWIFYQNAGTICWGSYIAGCHFMLHSLLCEKGLLSSALPNMDSLLQGLKNTPTTMGPVSRPSTLKAFLEAHFRRLATLAKGSDGVTPGLTVDEFRFSSGFTVSFKRELSEG